MSDYKVEIGVEVDTGDIQNQIKKAKVAPIKVNLDIENSNTEIRAVKKELSAMNFSNSSIRKITKDLDKMNLSISKVVTNFKKNGNLEISVKGIDKFNRSVSLVREYTKKGDLLNGKKISQSFKTEIDEVNEAFKLLKQKQKEINSLEFKLAGLNSKEDIAEIKEITSQIRVLKKEYDSLHSGIKDKLSVSQNNELKKITQDAENRVKRLKSQMKDEIQFKIDTGDFDKDIADIEAKLRKMNNVPEELKKNVTQLKSIRTRMSNALAKEDNDRAVKEYDRYRKLLETTNNQVGIVSKADKDEASQIVDVFNQIKRTKKEIGDLEVELIGAKAKNDLKTIDEINKRLDEYRAKLEGLENLRPSAKKAKYTSKFTDRQNEELKAIDSEIEYNKKQAQNSVDYKASKQKEKDDAKELNDIYNKIYNTRKRIGDLEVDLIDAEAKNDVKAIKDINDEITRLKNNLASLDSDNIGSKFTNEQKANLKELRKQTQYNKKQAQNSVDYKDSKQKEKEEARKVNDAYNEIYNTKKRIGDLEVKLISAEDTKDAQNLRNEIERLKNDLLALDKNGVSSKFTEKQKKSIENLENQINFNKKQAENKVDVKLELQIDKEEAAKAKEEAREIKESFEELKRLATEMGKIDIELAGLTDVDQDIDKFNSLKRMAEELEVEFQVLYEKIGKNLDTDQIKELDQIFASTTGAVRELNNEMARTSDESELTSGLERLKTIAKEINSLNIDIFKFEDADNIEKAINRLEELEKEATELRLTLQQKFNVQSFDEVDDIARQGKEALDSLIAKVEEARAKLARDIKVDIKSGALQREINDVSESFSLLNIENQNVENGIERLKSLLNSMDSNSDIESVTNDYKEFLQLLDTVKNKVRELQREQSNSSEMLDIKKESAMMKLNNLFEQGSKAAEKFGARARELAEELNNCGEANIDNVTRKVANLGEEVKKSGLQTKTFTTRLKEQFSKYSQYLSIASVFMYAEQAMRDMFQQVLAIDTAMTELKKVTDESNDSYNKFLSNAAKRAKELGTTIDGLVTSTADFARLGYSFEQSQGLAEVANIYAVVGDEIEGVEDATQSLVSTMAAFKSEMNSMNDSDFAMGIVDKMNEVSNNFAISSGGIGQALQRSASSMAAANNTLDETIALITAANTVAQNPEKVGNAFKTKFLYCLCVQKCA